MAQAPHSKSRLTANAGEAHAASEPENSDDGHSAEGEPAAESPAVESPTGQSTAGESTAGSSADGSSTDGETQPASSHPHFDDGGAHRWETEFEAAIARARAENKLVFIEMGREQCGQCRALVQNVLTREDLRELVEERYVMLASDCDEPEDEVLDLAHKLEDAMMLPFVLIVDAQGQFIEGSSGAQDAGTLKRTLERLAPDRAETDAE
jgi:thiol:disulfide interchange protein